MKTIKKHWLPLFLILDIILLASILYAYRNPEGLADSHTSNHDHQESAVSNVLHFVGDIENGVAHTLYSAVHFISSSWPGHKANHAMIDAPQIAQNPELPRGCEVTSLAMLLQQAGVNVGKMTLANKIAKVPYQSGSYYGNPNDGFVGNMETLNEPGLGVNHGPLLQLAKYYLPNQIVDLTGRSFDTVLNQLRAGIPVMVITNSHFKPLLDSAFRTWNTSSGTIKITFFEHAVLVTGFDKKYIYFNNPLGSKNEKAEREPFIKAWKQMGSQAISYTKY